MKVSICMITYGHEKFIAQAIDGVLMQVADFDFELIISNDNSPDSTDKVVLSIIKSHPKGHKIRYFNHSINKGMMPNFIFSLEKCEGEYIALCEGDDYWTDPLKLQKQLEFLDANQDYVLCFHQVDIVKKDGEIVNDFLTIVPEKHEDIKTLALLGNYIHTPSVVYRNIIKQFPTEFEKTPIGDFFLYLILAEKGKLKYLNEKMAVYRYAVGIFSTKSALESIKSYLILYTCLISYLKDEEIKNIIFQKQLKAVASLENIIKDDFKNYFVSKKPFFKAIKFIEDNLQQPSVITKKIRSYFLK